MLWAYEESLSNPQILETTVLQTLNQNNAGRHWAYMRQQYAVLVALYTGSSREEGDIFQLKYGLAEAMRERL